MTQTGIHFEGHSHPQSPESVQEIGRQFSSLVKAAHDARLEQDTIIRLIEVFGKSVAGAPGITDSSITGTTVTLSPPERHDDEPGNCVTCDC